MGAAVLWGAVAASSLVVGAWLGVWRRWPDKVTGAVLAFGAGALISAVSYDLVREGAQLDGGAGVAAGLAVGALAYFAADRALERSGSRHRTGPSAGTGAGPALALGAFLDGIPEQAVLGIGLAAGEGVSVALLAAIFVSNLPEAVGSSTQMRADGRATGTVMRLWVAIAVVCAVATVGGYLVADFASPRLQAAIDGFAAGALLVMLIDSMIPEAARKSGLVAGLFTTLGFAAAAFLSVSG
ncbi:ZIP family metal transporter [Luteimicrobium sp. NPDC057192]|uniref:ZIP family metal transporter n=1 Tax=Luteimicrobium sp. NPDC057192 TaxID=3346042 RepID=UPI00362B3776